MAAIDIVQAVTIVISTKVIQKEKRIDIEQYLSGVELVVVGGESDRNARPPDYDWVLHIRTQFVNAKISFEFRQCGTHFIKDTKVYHLKTKDLCSQARKAGIHYNPNVIL